MSQQFKLDRKTDKRMGEELLLFAAVKLLPTLHIVIVVLSDYVNSALFELFSEHRTTVGHAFSNWLHYERAVTIANNMLLTKSIASSHYTDWCEMWLA